MYHYIIIYRSFETKLLKLEKAGELKILIKSDCDSCHLKEKTLKNKVIYIITLLENSFKENIKIYPETRYILIYLRNI